MPNLHATAWQFGALAADVTLLLVSEDVLRAINTGLGTASQYERVSYLLVPACIEPNCPTDSLTLEPGKLHVFE